MQCHSKRNIVVGPRQVSFVKLIRVLYLLFTNREESPMRLVLAIFLPFTVFFTIGRPLAGIICLILQLTLIGWLPAAIWAVYALGQYNTDKKIEQALNGNKN